MSKSVSVRLAGFALLVGLQALAVHWLITWSLQRVTVTDLGAFNRAMQGRVNADIVVTGSSRAFRHYDPRILAEITGASAFNLGRNASQTDVQLGVLRAYLRHNRKPRLLIHNLDLQSLVLTKPGEVYDPAQYVPYLGDPDLHASLARINDHLWKWRYLPLYPYAVEDTFFTWTVGLRCLVGLGPRENCFDGFAPMDRSWTREFDRFRKRHPDGIDIPIDDGAVQDLEEIVALCRREGIRVLLVYSPQYHEMIGLTRNRERIFAHFNEIARRQGVPLLDYTDSPLSRDRDLFYNAQHLNARGADLFSRDLARQVLDLGLLAERANP